MANLNYKDSRGFFILPNREEASYYTYGTPEHGQGQFAHPLMLTLIFWVEVQWGMIDNRKFGVGNISKYNGRSFKPDHDGHLNGLQVDIRPLRKDGKDDKVNINKKHEYDREGTKKLIEVFYASGMVHHILFNDTSIPRVRPASKDHDNHFHVEIVMAPEKNVQCSVPSKNLVPRCGSTSIFNNNNGN